MPGRCAPTAPQRMREARAATALPGRAGRRATVPRLSGRRRCCALLDREPRPPLHLTLHRRGGRALRGRAVPRAPLHRREPRAATLPRCSRVSSLRSSSRPSPLDSHPDHRAAGLLHDRSATARRGAGWCATGSCTVARAGRARGAAAGSAADARAARRARSSPRPFALEPAEEDRKLAALRAYADPDARHGTLPARPSCAPPSSSRRAHAERRRS